MNPLDKEAEDAFAAFWQERGSIVTAKDTFLIAYLEGRKAGLEAAKESLSYLIYKMEK